MSRPALDPRGALWYISAMDNFSDAGHYCVVCGTLLDTVSVMDGSPICDAAECEDEYAEAMENL